MNGQLRVVLELEAQMSKMIEVSLTRAEDILRDHGATEAEVEAEMQLQRLALSEAYRENLGFFLRVLQEPAAPSHLVQ